MVRIAEKGISKILGALKTLIFRKVSNVVIPFLLVENSRVFLKVLGIIVFIDPIRTTNINTLNSYYFKERIGIVFRKRYIK